MDMLVQVANMEINKHELIKWWTVKQLQDS